MRKSYHSVGRYAKAEFEEKRSKFIAAVKPVETEEQAVAFINGVRAEHRMASHNVYAYTVSCPVGSKRYSDDGEPQGTAGMPVLNVIEKNSLEDIAIVVTRYFGGTLLGAAGLIRAYGRAAALGVEEAGIVRYTLCDEVHIMVGYPLFSIIKKEIENSGYTVKDQTYGLDVELIVQVETGLSDSFIERIADLTSGAAVTAKTGLSYNISD